MFDVAVDMRRRSPTFGRWVGVELSDDDQRQLWIPPGFAHGFLVLSESADFLYKTTDYYAPADEIAHPLGRSRAGDRLARRSACRTCSRSKDRVAPILEAAPPDARNANLPACARRRRTPACTLLRSAD